MTRVEEAGAETGSDGCSALGVQGRASSSGRSIKREPIPEPRERGATCPCIWDKIRWLSRALEGGPWIGMSTIRDRWAPPLHGNTAV